MDKLIIVKRWLEKSQRCNNNIDGVMDKFFSLYVAYNAFFSMHTKAKDGDRAGATTVIAKYLKNHKIDVLNTYKAEIYKMIKPVQEGRFKIYGESAQADDKKDSIIIQKIQEDTNNYRAVLNFIYGIRCNMFHGEKELIAEQQELLVPANIILEKLLETLIENETQLSLK